jgi:hypothetical protein
VDLHNALIAPSLQALAANCLRAMRLCYVAPPHIAPDVTCCTSIAFPPPGETPQEKGVRHFQKVAVVLGMAGACWLSTSLPASAEPFTVEFRFDVKKGEPGQPNEYTKLGFANGSNRYVALVRRSGKAVGERMLRGATVQDWGFHEVTFGLETDGRGTGYLVISRSPGDIIYL